MTDIIDRLKGYADASEAMGLYTEAKCAYDAIEIITIQRELLHLKDESLKHKEKTIASYKEICDIKDETITTLKSVIQIVDDVLGEKNHEKT
jgi:hypothetical protein